MSVATRLEGRTCEALLVHEAYRGGELLDGVAQLSLRLGPRAWVRFYFEGGGYSWAESSDAPEAPEDPAGDVRFAAVDVAALLGLRGRRVTLVELAPRAGAAGRLALGFDSGVVVSVEHDGRASRLRLVPPAP